MISEPTDPRIVEIAARQQKANTEHLASGAHADNWDEECPACVGQLESETHANRDRSYLLNALSLLQQRLEQVTAERAQDQQRLFHYEGLIETQRGALEAAEATIASLSALLRKLRERREFSGSCDVPGCGCDGSELLIEVDAALASLPSSAVSRTAERQP